MGNVFVGTPPVWTIDTASSTPVSTDTLRIDSIKWVPGTAGAAGDECKVTDAAGNVIFDEFATGAEEDLFQLKMPDKTNTIGLAVPTLGHGKVWIYLK